MSNASPSETQMSPPRAIEVQALTFGIEYEFALATRLTPDGPDPEPEREENIDLNTSGRPHYLEDAWVSVQKHVARTLIKYGIPAFASMEPVTAQDILYTINNPGSELTSTNAFTVAEDCSVKAPDQRYAYYPIEIKTNPMSFSDFSLDVVERVPNVLIYTYRTSPTHLTSNSSTGLHIHIGNGPHGLDTKTIRCLAAFLWVFESPLASMHPPHRRTNAYCQPPSVSQLGLDLDAPNGSHAALAEGYERIMHASNGNAVVSMMCVSGRGAYNFENLRRPFVTGDTKRTVEFRLHEGTLDPERIVRWARVCHGMVRWARDIPQDDIARFLKCYLATLAAGLAEMSVGDMLGVLGLGDSAAYYQTRMDREKLKEKEEKERVEKGKAIELVAREQLHIIDPENLRFMDQYAEVADDPFGIGGGVEVGEGGRRDHGFGSGSVVDHQTRVWNLFKGPEKGKNEVEKKEEDGTHNKVDGKGKAAEEASKVRRNHQLVSGSGSVDDDQIEWSKLFLYREAEREKAEREKKDDGHDGDDDDDDNDDKV